MNINFKKLFGVLLLVMFTAIAIVYIKDLRCLIISNSDKFIAVKLDETKIYISNDTPKDTIELILELAKRSVDGNEIFWEEEIGEITSVRLRN